MGPMFNTWDKVIEFTNRCNQVSIASAIAIYKGLPFGWEAIQKEGLLNIEWRYVSPDKKERCLLVIISLASSTNHPESTLPK